MSDAPPLDFFVIGAYKAATTSLQAYLAAHPDVYVPDRKEPNFLAFEGAPDPPNTGSPRNPAYPTAVKTWQEYAALFDGRRGEPVAGEVSPEYLLNPHAPERIHRWYPDARLVAILRDPVERAYSDYLMYVRDGQEHDDFVTALARQAERYAVGDPTGHYVETGRYHTQLRRYVERFGRERLLVLLTEDLRTDPGATLGRLYQFLGVREVLPDDLLTDRNVAGVPTNRVVAAAYSLRRRLRPLVSGRIPEPVVHRLDRVLRRGLDRPDMPAEARATLVDLYRPEVDGLEELLGLDLTAWR